MALNGPTVVFPYNPNVGKTIQSAVFLWSLPPPAGQSYNIMHVQYERPVPSHGCFYTFRHRKSDRCICERVHAVLFAALHQSRSVIHWYLSLLPTSRGSSLQNSWLVCPSVFKTQTRPVNFPLITLHSSQSKAAHCIFPFISPVPLRQTQEWVLKGGMRVVVRGGAEEGETARLNLPFLPQGCVLLCCSLFV